MHLTELPQLPGIWAATPDAAKALILAQRERSRELEARLGQDSSKCSRPPSSDSPHVPPKRRAAPSGRKRGGQPGQRGAFRALLPVEPVDETVTVVPECCWHFGYPFLGPTARLRGRVWRHQVVELLPLAVRVTEYQIAVRPWHRAASKADRCWRS
jgi:transposase